MSVQCILEGQQDSTKFDKAGGTITGDVIIEDGNKICNSVKSASIQLNGDNTDGSVILSVDNNNAIILTGTETTIKNVVYPTEVHDAVNKYYVDNRIPVNHASTDTTYGIGGSNDYGHLKLSDSLEDLDSNEEGGVAATPNAVANLSSMLQEDITSRAPKNHASTLTTYGLGTITDYGHVKLSDSHTSTSGVSSGIAATPTAVKSAYDLANGKAPKAHASTATTYGTGSSTNYGHVKLSASTNSSSGTSSGVAATPSAVKAVYDLLGGKKIICGWSSVDYASSQRDKTIYFPPGTFNNPPVVIIGQPFNGVVCTVFHSSVYKDYFTVNVPGISGVSASTRDMAWIAIGT